LSSKLPYSRARIPVKRRAKNWFAALPLLARLLWILAGIELILLIGRAIA
jgi:hypothetical protein